MNRLQPRIPIDSVLGVCQVAVERDKLKKEGCHESVCSSNAERGECN